MTRDDPETTGQLREEAALWFARMRGEDAEQHRPGFEAWLARGALHRAAYNRIGEVFAAGKALREDSARGRGQRARRAAVAGSLLVVLAIGLGVGLGTSRHSPSSSPGVPTSRPAERNLGQVVSLGHGAQAVLDVDGKVLPGLGGDDRLVRLDSGRVRFIVPPGGMTRTILAGATAIQTSGGSFDIWRRPDGRIDAQALGGSARVMPAVLMTGGPGRVAPIRLIAGQRLVGTTGGRWSRARPRPGTDWPSGVLEYRGATLAEVLEEANRYGSAKIVADAPSTGRLKVSGRFAVLDSDRLARHLALALSLGDDRSRRGMITLRER